MTPTLIDHQDRVDCIREAVTLIAVRDGIGAVSLASVAEELHLSTATLRRYVRSPEVLPQLGLEWVEHRRRRRRFRVMTTSRAAGTTSWAHAVRCLEAEMPVDDGRAEEARAWHAVARGAATAPALELTESHRELVGSCVRHLVGLGTVTTPDQRPATEVSLRSTVGGLVLGVVEGWATPAEVHAELTRQLDRLAPPAATGVTVGRDLLAVAPAVNDR